MKIGNWKIEFKESLTILERREFLGKTKGINLLQVNTLTWEQALDLQIATLEVSVIKIEKKEGVKWIESDLNSFFEEAKENEVTQVFSEIQERQSQVISKKKKP